MSNAVQWIYHVISESVTWLTNWQFLGIPFLYFLIGFAILSIILDRIF